MNRFTRTRPGRAPRPGKTLIELLVVVSTSALLVLLSANLFHRLSLADRSFRDDTATSRVQFRLAQTFRKDARHATTAELESPTILALRTQFGPIRYKIVDRGLQRITPSARDLFPLEGLAPRFHIEGPITSLNLEPEPVESPTATKRRHPGFHVVAAIAADIPSNIEPPEAPLEIPNRPRIPRIAPKPPEAMQ